MRSKYDPYFTRDGKKWFCMRCPFEIVPKDSSTTSLSHHLRTKHPEQWNELDASNSQNNLNKSKKRPNSTTVDVWVSPTPSPLIANYVNSNSSSGSQPPPPKQMRLEDFLASWASNTEMTMKMDKIIVKYLTDCCLPPTHLHDHGFVHFLKELVPHYELKSKEYFCVDAVDELYHICKYKIKNELQNVEWFTLVINFTDSGHQNHAVYFRDRNFNLKHFVISSIIPTFPGLYGIKSETLFDHDIPLEKLVTIIHNEIRGHDIFDMKPYSFFCEDIVEILTESLERGWSFVVPDLVRNNRFIQRNDKFKTLVLTNPELESLSQKISTNSFADWNDKTTLKWDEIHASLKFYFYFKRIIENDLDNHWAGYELDEGLSDIGEEILEILEIFSQATKLLWNENNHLSVAIPVYRVLDMSLTPKREEFGCVNDFLTKMHSKFGDKLLDSKPYVLSTCLDPRFKMKYLKPEKKDEYFLWMTQELLPKNDETENLQKPNLNLIQPKLENPSEIEDLFAAFEQLQESTPKIPTSTDLKSTIIQEYNRFERETNLPKDKDPVTYWQISSHRYPTLFKIFKKLATIPGKNEDIEKISKFTPEKVKELHGSMTPEAMEKWLYLFSNSNLVNFKCDF